MSAQYVKWAFIAVLAAAAISLVIYFSGRQKERIPVSIINDTNIIYRYDAEHKRDTVYRFTDRILYKNSKPDIVYIQKTDTVFMDKILAADLPLRVEKYRGGLNIKSVNIKDSVLKEYVFGNVTRDFTVYSSQNGINVKSANFMFEQPDLSLKTFYRPCGGKVYYEIASETGLSFREKLFIYAGCGYETTDKNLFFSISLKLKGL